MFWFFLIAAWVVLTVVYVLLLKTITENRPDSYPTAQNRQKLNPTKKTLVCFGDSITHGNVSYDWVKDLSGDFPDMQVLNAGVNSDLTFSLLNRIEDVVACRPDIITILVGTNDVNATQSKEALSSYKLMGRIKKDTVPDFDSFKKNFDEIVSILKQNTGAKIALISLPLMGEDMTHEVNRKADDYSVYIEHRAQDEGLAYLPFREKEKTYLMANSQPSYHKFEETARLFTFSLINHFILSKDWDYISAKHRNQLTPDNLHLNSVSGGMLRDLVKAFILSTQH